MDITLTDGGIETRIIFEFKRSVGDFEAYRPQTNRPRNSSAHLAGADIRIWARDGMTCAREFDLAILGGCCGTDECYIEALAKAAVDEGQLPTQTPKNVTI